MVLGMMFVIGCQKRIMVHNSSGIRHCKQSVENIILDFDEGDYRQATLDETIDMLECIEILKD